MDLRRLTAVLLTLLLSCAYLNTFYNAKTTFKSAENAYKKNGSAQNLRKQYDEVITKCSKVLDKYPKSHYVDDALYLMAISYERLGQNRKAKRKFEELFTFYPNSPYASRAKVEYANVLLKLKEYEKVNNLIEELAKQKKNGDDITFLVVKMAEMLGERKRVVELCKKFLLNFKKKQKKKEILIVGSQNSLAINDLKDASIFIKELLKQNLTTEEDFQAKISLVNLYKKEKKFNDALSILKSLQVPAKSPKERIITLKKAEILLSMEDTSAYKKELRNIISENSKDSLAQIASWDLGEMLKNQDSLEIADTLYKKAQTGPLAGLKKQAQLYSSLIEEAIAISDSSGDSTKLRLAEIYFFYLNRPDKAEEIYKELSLHSQYPKIRSKSLYALLYIYSKVKMDTTKAFKFFKTYPDTLVDKNNLLPLLHEGFPFLFVRDTIK